MFTMTAVSYCLRNGSFSRRNTSTPGFSSPIAFSIPDGVLNMLGGGFPAIGSQEIPLPIPPPSRFRSTKSAYSSPYPNVPDAVSTGFLSLIPAKSTERFGLVLIFVFIFSIKTRRHKRAKVRKTSHRSRLTSYLLIFSTSEVSALPTRSPAHRTPAPLCIPVCNRLPSPEQSSPCTRPRRRPCALPPRHSRRPRVPQQACSQPRAWAAARRQRRLCGLFSRHDQDNRAAGRWTCPFSPGSRLPWQCAPSQHFL